MALDVAFGFCLWVPWFMLWKVHPDSQFAASTYEKLCPAKKGIEFVLHDEGKDQTNVEKSL